MIPVQFVNKIEKYHFNVPEELCGLLIGYHRATLNRIYQCYGAYCELDRTVHRTDQTKTFIISGEQQQIDGAMQFIQNRINLNLELIHVGSLGQPTYAQNVYQPQGDGNRNYIQSPTMQPLMPPSMLPMQPIRYQVPNMPLMVNTLQDVPGEMPPNGSPLLMEIANTSTNSSDQTDDATENSLKWIKYYRTMGKLGSKIIYRSTYFFHS